MDVSAAFPPGPDTPDHIALAEELGFRRAWVYDSPALYSDVWVTLGRAADRTSRIGLGTGVLIPSLRHVMVTAAALRYRHSLMAGRTHGIHAEPTTFGFKLAMWVDELRRCAARLGAAREDITVGAISGAVGTHATIPPRIEEYVCAQLGLRPAPASTQIIQRDRHAHFVTTLALIGSSLDKMATELRHLQRTELGALLANDVLVVRQVERRGLHAVTRIARREHGIHHTDG